MDIVHGRITDAGGHGWPAAKAEWPWKDRCPNTRFAPLWRLRRSFSVILKAFAAVALLIAVSLPVQAIDEVIINDPANGVVITRLTVNEMVQADAQAASLFGLPAPGPDAQEQLVTALRSDYASTEKPIKIMLGHAHRNLPLGLPLLSSRPAKARAAFVAKMKPEIMKATTPGSRLLNLTEVLVGLGEQGANSGTTGAAGQQARLFGFMQSQEQAQHMMQQGIRSGFTSCNTYNGSMQRNWSFCHP